MQIQLTPVIRQLFKVLITLSLVLTLSAFRHTDIEGYTDPDFTDYSFTTVVLQMPNATIEFRNMVEKKLAKKIKKQVKIYRHEDLFPPTREWDEQSTARIYEQYGIDAGLVIMVGGFESSSTAGMVFYNASTYGGMTTGTATQATFVRDSASFEMALIDVESHRKVWIGELDTRGAGLLFVGNKSTASGLVKALVRELKEKGHIRKR